MQGVSPKGLGESLECGDAGEGMMVTEYAYDPFPQTLASSVTRPGHWLLVTSKQSGGRRSPIHPCVLAPGSGLGTGFSSWMHLRLSHVYVSSPLDSLACQLIIDLEKMDKEWQ